MGAQIAGHLANAGIPVRLYDVTYAAAQSGIMRLRSLQPDPLFLPDRLELITPASLDEADLDASSDLALADWVVEAIIESLDAKRALLDRIGPRLGAHAVLSSNTSALPLASVGAGLPPELQRRFLGTHFFNPPRYVRLVELIPTATTDTAVVDQVRRFLDRRLGKGVVVARDRPGFIANRIGIAGALRLVDALATGVATVEEIDAVTGPLIGRPRSATFRTLDIVGLDVFRAVASDLGADRPDPAAVPSPGLVLIGQMVARGWLGDKAGQGFYRRVTTNGETERLAIDARTLEYRPVARTLGSSLDAVRAVDDVAERTRRLWVAPGWPGEIVRASVGATLVDAADVATSVAGSIDDIDRAMRWGFGWEIGPFETWDAIGIAQVLATLAVPAPAGPVAVAVAAGRGTLRDGPLPPAGPGITLARAARAAGRVVASNPGASLLDLGDGVFAVEFHSKMNTIGGDVLEMLHRGVARAEAEGQALVIGHDADPFSAGANLMLLLLEAQEGNWDEVDAMVRAFQGATQALKYAAVPVVAAPAGLALGGGCEVCLHTDRVQAASETYMGLVEVGVGLIPAGGGTKEMLIRANARADGGDRAAAVQAAFETIGLGRVSTSGDDARRLGYLRPVDSLTMNRERVVADAKSVAVARAAAGYAPPPAALIPVGGAALRARLELGVHLLHRAGRASDHDARIGRALARILAGGDAAHPAAVSEAYLLDLEREAFLSLCGEPKTLERIAHTLRTGKTLRN
jgi:3-hydroxyacyl-CoA dehydrogenase